MKWPWLSPQPGRLDFAHSDWFAGFANVHNLGIRGHTLIWHEGLPSWASTLTPAELAAQVEAHIHAVTSRYSAAARSWDVVNEPIQPGDGRSDGLRRDPFLSRLGPDYIPRALHLARQTAGAARLCISDYDLEYVGPYFEDRRSALLRLVEQLRRKRAPLDAVGLQSHLAAGAHAFDERGFRRFLADLASFSLRIEITELDVSDAVLPAALSHRDRRVADEYERYLSVALDEQAVDVVVTWGLSDRYTWLNTDAAPAGKRRRDRLHCRPLPLDAALCRKRAWHAIARAFRGAPMR